MNEKPIPDSTKISLIVNRACLDVRDVYTSSEHCVTQDRFYWLMRYVFHELSTLEDMLNDEIPRQRVNKMLKARYGGMSGFTTKEKKRGR